MQYSISKTDNIVCIAVEGNLNSLDLLFMFQSDEYKLAIAEHNKILIDYTDMNGVSLTPEDAMAIAMIGKMDLENLSKKDIAIAVDENERSVLEKVTSNIFSDSHSDIHVADSKAHAMEILRQV